MIHAINDINAINDEWANFCDDDYDSSLNDNNITNIKDRPKIESNNNNKMEIKIDKMNAANDISLSSPPPPISELYISTTTIISYLNAPIDINAVFWQIPIIPYSTPTIGVVKKQMKFILFSQDELDEITNKTKDYEYVENLTISKVNKPNSRIKFKEVRKVSIGIYRKDITSFRCKKKGAFMNCFVVILRILADGVYKEIHVKVFNTGKLEIPGIQSTKVLINALNVLIDILTPFVETNKPLAYLKDKNETVLINSNFNCGYYINRDKLYEILKYKYKINSVYDPCSYPGIQCEFYYHNNKIQNNINSSDTHHNNDQPTYKISFMIFRTGSVLIVGKCTEEILKELYEFLCTILIQEYHHIKENICESHIKYEKKNQKIFNIRKKYIN
jgi:hypothetical protein